MPVLLRYVLFPFGLSRLPEHGRISLTRLACTQATEATLEFRAAIAPVVQDAPANHDEELAQVRAVLAHITNKTAGAKMTLHKSTPGRKGASNPIQKAPAILERETKPAQSSDLRENFYDASAVQNKPATVGEGRKTASKPQPSLPDKPVTRSAATRQHPTKVHNTGKQAASAPPKPCQRANPAMPKITVPKSPFLRSKQRSAVHRQQVKSSEELELEELERAKRQAAALRLRNQRSVTVALQGESRIAETYRQAKPAQRPHPQKRALTEPKEPALRTSKRQRMHDMETRSMATASPWKSTAERVVAFQIGAGRKATEKKPAPRQHAQQHRGAQLTVPRTPKFATSARARPSRFKASEEEAISRAAAEARAMKFKMQQPTRKRAAPPQAPRPPTKHKTLTEPQPFSFATDARASQRNKPAPTFPLPFVFSANGPVTRSRAQVTVTHVPPEKHAPRPGSAPSSGTSEGTGGSLGMRGRRTTGGSGLLGRAQRVLRREMEPDNVEFVNATAVIAEISTHTGDRDGMQDIIKAGAGLTDRTTLHNPLFRA